MRALGVGLGVEVDAKPCWSFRARVRVLLGARVSFSVDAPHPHTHTPSHPNPIGIRRLSRERQAIALLGRGWTDRPGASDPCDAYALARTLYAHACVLRVMAGIS